MKRKLSFFIATVMMLSMLPAMNVFAKTANDTSKVVNAIATDYDWGATVSNMGGAVVLTLQNDATSGTFTNGTKFRVSLKNSEWSFSKSDFNSAGLGNVNTQFITSGTALGGYSVAPNGTLEVGINSGANSTILNNFTTQSGQQYIIQYISATEAEVILVGGNYQAGKSTKVYVPLVTKITGSGAATVTVTDSTGSGVTQGTYTYANGVEGAINVTVADPNKTTASDLSLSDVTLTESSPGKLEIANDGVTTSYIDLLAPTGYIWANPTGSSTADGQMNPKMTFYGGFINNPEITYKSMARLSGDRQTLRINLSTIALPSGGYDKNPVAGTTGLTRSTTSAGLAAVTGLKLVKDGDPVLGDINVRFQGAGLSTQSYKVGVYAKRAVTMTAADKAIPEIVSGIYTHDPKASGECLEVTLQETTKGSWIAGSEGGKLILVPGDGWKFRAVELTTIDGIDTSLSALTAKGTAYLDSSTISDPTVKGVTLADDKLTLDRFQRKGNDAIKISMKIWATVKPGYTGDLVLKTSTDNEAFGLALSSVIGKAIDPFVVTATPSTASIGYMNVPLGDITIKETKAGNFKRTDAHDSYMDSNGNVAASKTDSNGTTINSWAGRDSYHTGGYRFFIGNGNYVSFNNNGNVKASVVNPVSGSAEIDECVVTTGYYSAGSSAFGRSNVGEINLKIKRESTTPTEIKITGASIDTMRSLASGKLDLRLGGSAVGNFGVSNRGEGAFDVDSYVAVKDYVNLGGTANPDNPSQFTTKVGATVGKKSLSVDGKEVVTDVAPINKNGNVLVPVYPILKAVGYQEQHIKWDPNEKSVTIQEPVTGRTIKIKIGSNKIIVNGIDIAFEGEPAQIIDSRTYLPFRALGEVVLNTKVTWDQATTTAWFNQDVATTAVPNAQ